MEKMELSFIQKITGTGLKVKKVDKEIYLVFILKINFSSQLEKVVFNSQKMGNRGNLLN